MREGAFIDPRATASGEIEYLDGPVQVFAVSCYPIQVGQEPYHHAGQIMVLPRLMAQDHSVDEV